MFNANESTIGGILQFISSKLAELTNCIPTNGFILILNGLYFHVLREWIGKWSSIKFTHTNRTMK